MRRTKENILRWEAERELKKTSLVTVINPLLQSLADEHYYLGRKNWSWRYESRRFEFLLPIDEYIEARYLPNFQQFCRSHREVSAKGRSHDQMLKVLEESVAKAFDVLIACEPFQRAYTSCLTKSKSQGLDVSWANRYKSSSHGLQIVAEYVVNNIHELPSAYSTAGFWQTHGSTFHTIAIEHAGQLLHEVSHRGVRLAKVNEQLTSALERLRSDYVRRFSIPPVPIAMDVL